jgi:hypothetical protein
MIEVQTTLVASPRNHLYRTGHSLIEFGPLCFGLNAKLDHFCLAEAVKAFTRCPAAPTPHTPLRLAPPGQDWYEPSDLPVACNKCMNDCGDTYAEQVDKGNFSGRLCFISVACAAAAFAEWVACLGICHLPGKACFPVPCGGLHTCVPGDQCFGYKDGEVLLDPRGAVASELAAGAQKVMELANDSAALSAGCPCAEAP